MRVDPPPDERANLTLNRGVLAKILFSFFRLAPTHCTNEKIIPFGRTHFSKTLPNLLFYVFRKNAFYYSYH